MISYRVSILKVKATKNDFLQGREAVVEITD